MSNPLARKYRLPHGAQRRIARKRRVSESYVSQVINGHATPRSPRGMRKYLAVRGDVAAELGVTVQEAFPDITPPGAAPEVGAADAAFSAVA